MTAVQQLAPFLFGNVDMTSGSHGASLGHELVDASTESSIPSAAVSNTKNMPAIVGSGAFLRSGGTVFAKKLQKPQISAKTPHFQGGFSPLTQLLRHYYRYRYQLSSNGWKTVRQITGSCNEKYRRFF